jgi:upstream activation factor subunit UAF30
MSAVKQSKKSKSVEPKVVEPKVVEPKVVEPKVVEPKVVEAKVEKPKKVKGDEPKEVDNVVVPVHQTEGSLQESFTGVVSLLADMNGLLSKVKSEVKVLEKQVSKEMKVLDKINQKKNKNKGSRAPSGFVKPTKISDELAGFLKKDKGTMMARTDVTKEMTAYIRENSLQDKTNGRKILPDAKLKKLLKVTDSDELTYFNLQKFMSPHFEKSVKA